MGKTKIDWCDKVRKKDLFREKNPFWKGGRTVASNGYVLIKVGREHHLADVRGYAYEHRIVAENKIGRLLRPAEQVHHVDGNKQNNSPENLEVVANISYHRLKERKVGLNRRLPGEENPAIYCHCDCGMSLFKYDSSGRPRKYISGHNSRRACGRF